MRHGRPWVTPRVAVVGGVALLVLAGASTAGVMAAFGGGNPRGSATPAQADDWALESAPVVPEDVGLEATPTATAGPSGPAASAGANGTVPRAAGFGYPVYTRAEIDAWSTGSAEYTRLAGSWAGNVNRAYQWRRAQGSRFRLSGLHPS